ncbi:MAG TPA: hypothetical protein VIR45_01170 [Kiloniellaceae bacterium]
MVQQIELEKVSMIYSAGERSIRRTLLLRILRLERQTWSALFAGCVCIGLSSQEAFAIDLVPPDTSSWVVYEAPAHGYAFKAPADWQPSYPDPETSRNIIVLLHPDNGSGCGLRYTPVASGVKIDIDGYIEYLTDDRLIEMASLKYSSVTLIEKKTIQVSDRKGILSIFGGKRGGGLSIVMTVSTVRENKIYELQCIFRPEAYGEIFPIFLVMGDSLEIAPD